MASKGSRKRRSTTPTVNEASPSPPAPSSAPPPRPPQAAAAPHPWPPQGGAAPHPWPPQVVAVHPRPPQGPVLPIYGAGIDGGQSSSANPWGGYLNMLQQPHLPPLRPFGENSHFVGVGNSKNPPSPATTPPGRVTVDIDVDDGVDARGAKKRFWVHDEEVKLASAWLNTSKDPIHGNDKKSDSFWGQITEKFNKDTPPYRIRDSNQLKCHWKRLSTIINEFNGYWASVCKLNKSGYSDDQLVDEAQKMFTQKHGKPFAHEHWWRILKNEPKWCTHAAQSDKDKSKPPGIDDKCEPRPIGREAAKAERSKGKRKADQLMDGIINLGDSINKIAEVAEERKKEREKATEAQFEITKMNLKVVEGQKEVKFLELYNSLVKQDTSNMTNGEKGTRVKTLKWLQNKLMPTNEEA